MAKCKTCGKKGLFFKVNSDGFCSVCEKQEQAKRETEKLQLDIQNLVWKKQIAEDDTKRANSELQSAQMVLEKAKDDITAAKNTAAKYRNFAKSIKESMKVVWDDNAWRVSDQQRQDWANADLDELLPEPDLQCLTVKELAAKYKKVRKDVIELCKAYEERYNTKTIAALYKLMVLALESEFENILYKLQFGRLDAGVDAVKELTAKYYVIATDGNQNIAPTIKRFIVQLETLYIDALNIEYEYYVQRERAKEEQRAIREQMRQEAEERKRLEQERKKVEAEENKYKQEIDRITSQMQQAHDAELEELRKRLEEVNALVSKVEEKKEEIINLQNGKAGTVYVISNIGSFGDHVYKIGMTRRIDPQDRVNELGDASVPFPFDVHSFIFSEDAVALETALHHELDNRRVNKVNLRKEFFNVSIDELQQIVERIDPTAPFKVTALAEQYRQSLSIAEGNG